MLILGLLLRYFDAAVVFIKKTLLLFRLTLAILYSSSILGGYIGTESSLLYNLVSIKENTASQQFNDFFCLPATIWRISPFFLRKIFHTVQKNGFQIKLTANSLICFCCLLPRLASSSILAIIAPNSRSFLWIDWDNSALLRSISAAASWLTRRSPSIFLLDFSTSFLA